MTVTVCVGLEGPKLFMLDAQTLETLATLPLPPRVPGTGNIFNDFAGGGYFYLDERDRAVIPTTSRHVYVVRQNAAGTGFELVRGYDLTAAVGLRLRSGRLRLRVVGAGTRQVRRVTFYASGKRIRRDRSRPFRATVARKRLARRGRTKVVARMVREDGTRAKRVKRVRARARR